MQLTEEYLDQKLEELKEFHLIDADLYPSLDLYMDQVTTFMEQHLDPMRRNEEDKGLTKTMINNYAKSTLLPAPEKKKYTKEHLMLLMMIFYMKNVLSMTDIQSALEPLIGESFEARRTGTDTESLEKIYRKITEGTAEIGATVAEDAKKIRNRVSSLFPEDPELAETAFLQLFSYDMFLRKALIERMIDDRLEEQKEQKAKEAEARAAAKAEAKASAREAKLASKEAIREAKQAAKAAAQSPSSSSSLR